MVLCMNFEDCTAIFKVHILYSYGDGDGDDGDGLGEG